jgi:hypothetical protein
LPSSKFLKDLNTGSKGEALVQAVLAKADIDSEAGGRNAAFDLKHTKPITFMSEIKFDLYAARSGNIAIEFYNPKQGKPSGIGVTQAHLWFHVITKPMSIWVTSVCKLKKYMEENKPHRVVECGGDNNASIYLYKQDVIFNAIFHRIDECPALELGDILLKLLTEDGVLHNSVNVLT